jgi:hypothetical protein
MNENSHPGAGKISIHGNGLGVPSPEQVEQRAREIAMIGEREANKFTDADWEEARRQLMGGGHRAAPEADAEAVEEIVDRDEVVGESGHHAHRAADDDDESLGEQLVSGGIEEAAHDQMVEARREELADERSES